MESICPYEKEKYPKRMKKVVEIEFTSPRDHSMAGEPAGERVWQGCTLYFLHIDR